MLVMACNWLVSWVSLTCSAALLLRYALKLEPEAQAIENAVSRAIESGVLPADLAPAGKAVSTRAAADAVLAAL